MARLVAVEQEMIEVIDLDDDSPGHSVKDTTSNNHEDDDDIDEDALVPIQPKHFRRLDFQPGCPVIRFRRFSGDNLDISFGTVTEAFVDMDKGTRFYALDSGTKCRKQGLHFGRGANVWCVCLQEMGILSLEWS
jgi:hypothetical protein